MRDGTIPLEVHVNPQSFYRPPPHINTGPEDEYHTFFITGNPGLIAYYHTFLACLVQLLDEKRGVSSGVHVYGHSLAGFQPFDSPGDAPHAPYRLQQQIGYVEETLQSYVRSQRLRSANQEGEHPGGASSQRSLKIILIGHSVGAYILLELIRRHRKQVSLGRGEEMDIVGGVLLFPTITHIAKSPSGVKLGWLVNLPHLALIVSTLVHVLTLLVPRRVLCNLVKLVTGFPKDAAETTTAFIKSPIGVRQALHMARDEMNEITEDRWDEEIWGASESDSNTVRAKLVFYFGKDDHWVAEHTRDGLIHTRAFKEDQPDDRKPQMFIDEDGIPHGFCIKHSEMVAKKVVTFVQDIITKSS
ncbi:MAG: hypothetical protein M1830_008054 [Pleopsidium flavum]|nr:MAG: hypothetical protein M1830_008054 [Pleopsidium flavum]